MIAVIYLGAAKFRDYTRMNHEMLFNQLRSNWPITVYDYTDPNIDWKSWPMVENVKIQEVYSFLEVLNRVQEKVVIKLNTDTWFTSQAVDAVVQETALIADGSTDACFVGMELSEDFAVDYHRIKVEKTVKVQDTVVIVHTDRINKGTVAQQELEQDHKAQSRNRAYRHLVSKDSNAVSIHTQLPMVCDDRLPATDYDVTMTYVNAFGNRTPKARMFWTLKRPMQD